MSGIMTVEGPARLDIELSKGVLECAVQSANIRSFITTLPEYYRTLSTLTYLACITYNPMYTCYSPKVEGLDLIIAGWVEDRIVAK